MSGEKDFLKTPEVVHGQGYEVPTIIGLGSGKGFDFTGLHLPIGWQKAIPFLQEFNLERFQTYFSDYCQLRHLDPPTLTIDPSTGLITRFSLRTEPQSHLALTPQVYGENRGMYKAKNVTDLRVAIALQQNLARFLRVISEKSGNDETYAHIDGANDQGYRSYGLKLPAWCQKATEPVTNTHYRTAFIMEANNIAGRFGEDLFSPPEFDDKGVFTGVDLRRGSATGYYLDKGTYVSHNVDTPEQASTLHAITAKFINDMAKRKPK